ncbi:WAT1-related protein, partial [Mucuna pruriens]
MGWFQYYLPVMAMVLIQFIYAGINLSTRVAFLQGMSPRVFVVYRHAFATIVIAPIAYFSRMERVNIQSWRSLAKIIGTAICVSGAVSMALLKGPKLLNAENLPSKSILGSAPDDKWLLGCLFLIGGCCAWSLLLILQVPASKSHPDHLSFSAWMCFMASLQSAAVTALLEPDPNAWKIHSLLQFGCTLYSGVMGSAVVLFIQVWCISQRGPLFSAMFNPLFTVIVTILAALLLHEEMYIGSLLGAIGVIIGLYVVLWSKAEEVVLNVNTDPKSMVNPTEEVKILINESSKTNLQEPLLSADSPSHH